MVSGGLSDQCAMFLAHVGLGWVPDKVGHPRLINRAWKHSSHKKCAAGGGHSHCAPAGTFCGRVVPAVGDPKCNKSDFIAHGPRIEQMKTRNAEDSCERSDRIQTDLLIARLLVLETSLECRKT